VVEFRLAAEEVVGHHNCPCPGHRSQHAVAAKELGLRKAHHSLLLRIHHVRLRVRRSCRDHLLVAATAQGHGLLRDARGLRRSLQIAAPKEQALLMVQWELGVAARAPDWQGRLTTC